MTISEGDRVKLVSTTDEYTSLEPGDAGTVTDVQELKPPLVPEPETKYCIDWDDGSNLAMFDSQDEIAPAE